LTDRDDESLETGTQYKNKGDNMKFPAIIKNAVNALSVRTLCLVGHHSPVIVNTYYNGAKVRLTTCRDCG
jgi:hypothetical protein